MYFILYLSKSLLFVLSTTSNLYEHIDEGLKNGLIESFIESFRAKVIV
jgi:hypothetical protein